MGEGLIATSIEQIREESPKKFERRCRLEGCTIRDASGVPDKKISYPSF